MPRGGFRPGAGRKSKGNHLSPAAIESIRKQIKARHIVKRLNQIAAGEVDATASSVTAGLGLLRKIVPDLAALQLSGDAENPVEVIQRIELVAPDDHGSD